MTIGRLDWDEVLAHAHRLAGRGGAPVPPDAAGLDVTTVKDVSPQAHNGCRPKKRRRV